MNGRTPQRSRSTSLLAPRLLLALLALLIGCSGQISDAGGSPDDDRRPRPPSGGRDPEPLVLPTIAELAPYGRLTKPEYRYVAGDLLVGADETARRAVLSTVDDFAENNYSGFYQNHTFLQAEPRLASLQLAFATALARAFPSSDLHRELCASGAACGEAIVDELLPRIWKRAIPADERAELLTLHAELPSEVFFTRVFASPWFHFKIFAAEPPTSREVARKHAHLIAFSLVGTFADEALHADLDAGRLDDAGPDVWEPHVRRLLTTNPRRFAVLFLPQWLGMSSLYETDDVYEGVPLRVVMTEPARTFAALLADGESIGSLLVPEAHQVEARLAAIYGKELVADETGWGPIDLDATIFGSAAMSAMFVDHETGYPNPIRRGSYVVNRLLCRDIRFPSSAVQSEIDRILETVPEGLSPPERMAYLRSHDTCAACHEQFDHFGLALEEIGALGEPMTTYYTGDPVEVAGEIGDLAFDSSVDFARQLGQTRELQTCFAAQVHSYLSGGGHVEANRRLRDHADPYLDASIEDVVVEMALLALGFSDEGVSESIEGEDR